MKLKATHLMSGMVLILATLLTGCGGGSSAITNRFDGRREILWGYEATADGMYGDIGPTQVSKGIFQSSADFNLHGSTFGSAEGSIAPDGTITFTAQLQPSPNPPNSDLQQRTARLELSGRVVSKEDPGYKPYFFGPAEVRFYDQAGKLIQTNAVSVAVLDASNRSVTDAERQLKLAGKY